MRFESPWFLLLLLLIPVLLYYRIRQRKDGKARLKYSSLESIRAAGIPETVRLHHLPSMIRVFSILLLILAVARPQSYIEIKKSYVEGLDIVLAIDTSTSMRAEDLERGKNRLDVAKEVVEWFLSKRDDDRVGMVVFAAVAFTQCPLTLDYALVKEYLDELKTGMVEDGTAIGNALASSVNRLRKSKAKSKIVILLTDGMNNRGAIDPLTAADMAKEYGVRVYTIGVGSRGTAPYPVQDMFGRTFYQQVQVEIDEDLLREISQKTAGKYYRATDKNELKKIFEEIDQLEKTKIESLGERRYRELFPWLLVPAWLLALLELVLRQTWFRVLP